MSSILRSVGLDVGTTTTQLIVSELTIENRASSFTVPEMEIAQRRILYKSPVYETPLIREQLVDGEAIRDIVVQEYQKAGIDRSRIDTGAIIITGETSRKENARTVLSALSDFAGEFVVATAGPDLESVLAAKGAGADLWSEKTGKTVLHMDIGGGTSNLALLQDGTIQKTGCLDVGGRLIKWDKGGSITYVSPVLQGLTSLKPGDPADPEALQEVAALLTQTLEMAAGRREPTDLLSRLTTAETGRAWEPPTEAVTVSFSGGVADCMEKDRDWQEFGDLGVLLGQAIRKSRLCADAYILGSETIRATVIGAGCHSAQLSGSTVFHQNISFPLKNVPVVEGLDPQGQEGPVVLALPEIPSPAYQQIVTLAEEILQTGKEPFFLCLEQDMAKALGQALAVRLPNNARILCIDRVKAGPGSYLDIGAPVEGALPVVVKTLVLGR